MRREHPHQGIVLEPPVLGRQAVQPAEEQHRRVEQGIATKMAERAGVLASMWSPTREIHSQQRGASQVRERLRQLPLSLAVRAMHIKRKWRTWLPLLD